MAPDLVPPKVTTRRRVFPAPAPPQTPLVDPRGIAGRPLPAAPATIRAYEHYHQMALDEGSTSSEIAGAEQAMAWMDKQGIPPVFHGDNGAKLAGARSFEADRIKSLFGAGDQKLVGRIREVRLVKGVSETEMWGEVLYDQKTGVLRLSRDVVGTTGKDAFSATGQQVASALRVEKQLLKKGSLLTKTEIAGLRATALSESGDALDLKQLRKTQWKNWHAPDGQINRLPMAARLEAHTQKMRDWLELETERRWAKESAAWLKQAEKLESKIEIAGKARVIKTEEHARALLMQDALKKKIKAGAIQVEYGTKKQAAGVNKWLRRYVGDSNITTEGISGELRQQTKRAVDDLSKFVSKNIAKAATQPTVFQLTEGSKSKRAFWNSFARFGLSEPLPAGGPSQSMIAFHARGANYRAAFFHEYGHHIESISAHEQAAKEFLAIRAKEYGHVRVALHKGEVAWHDGFLDLYTGKIYADGFTEIISVGLEYLAADNPLELALNWRFDPDHIAFVASIVDGAWLR